MKLTILGSGTSQGIPVIACPCPVCKSQDPRDKRLRSSAMLEIDGKKIIIDAGPDFRTQMLREGVEDIRAILLTHGHKDHIGGLDDIRAFNWVKNGEPVDIYLNAPTYEAVKREYAYAFEENKYPGVPEFRIHIIDKNPFYIDDIEIIPIPVLHYRMPVLGFRIGNFAYITDAKYIPEDSYQKLQGIDYLVVNALRREEHLSHFTLDEAISVIHSLQVKHAWLTHIGHQMGSTEELLNILPDNIFPALDGMRVEF